VEARSAVQVERAWRAGRGVGGGWGRERRRVERRGRRSSRKEGEENGERGVRRGWVRVARMRVWWERCDVSAVWAVARLWREG
jgi:hypothetical protein